ncbi:MAG: TetR/AcrR family transcriptional regulator [Armatimonadota bacterium]
MRPVQRHSPTKAKLLAAALRLMITKGYEATSVDEICTRAGVTKGSFFHYFANKEDLGKATLQLYFTSVRSATESAPFQRERDPLKRIYGYLDFVGEASQDPRMPRGCLIGTFSQELAETHPEIRTLCGRYFTAWADLLKGDLDAAKAKYAPRAPFDTRSLAEHFLAVMEGALILAKTHQDMTIVGEHARHFKDYVRSLYEGRSNISKGCR